MFTLKQCLAAETATRFTFETCEPSHEGRYCIGRIHKNVDDAIKQRIGLCVAPPFLVFVQQSLCGPTATVAYVWRA